jgi:hypothetical protein
MEYRPFRSAISGFPPACAHFDEPNQKTAHIQGLDQHPVARAVSVRNSRTKTGHHAGDQRLLLRVKVTRADGCKTQRRIYRSVGCAV